MPFVDLSDGDVHYEDTAIEQDPYYMRIKHVLLRAGGSLPATALRSLLSAEARSGFTDAQEVRFARALRRLLRRGEVTAAGKGRSRVYTLVEEAS